MWIRILFRRLVLALQFLTRLPIRARLELEEQDFPGSMVFFPWVGWLIGILAVLPAIVIFAITTNYLLFGVVTAMVMALLTGALHMDGFADVCDAYFSMKDKEGALAIMKDSRLGTFGVLALVFTVLMKTGCLMGLAECLYGTELILTVAGMAVCGRMAIVFAAWIGHSARPSGIGRLYLDNCRWYHWMIAAGLAFVCYINAPGTYVWMLSASCFAGFMVWLMTRKRFGGMTGDCLGAAGEIAEIMYLLGILIFVLNG